MLRIGNRSLSLLLYSLCIGQRTTETNHSRAQTTRKTDELHHYKEQHGRVVANNTSRLASYHRNKPKDAFKTNELVLTAYLRFPATNDGKQKNNEDRITRGHARRATAAFCLERGFRSSERSMNAKKCRSGSSLSSSDVSCSESTKQRTDHWTNWPISTTTLLPLAAFSSRVRRDPEHRDDHSDQSSSIKTHVHWWPSV